MPAFAPQVLSEEQLKKLYQFLSSVSPSPDVAELPIEEPGRRALKK